MKKYVSDYPNLMKEWDWDKNKSLDPNTTAHKSNKNAWWICCSKNHSWSSKISSRSNGVGCPFCCNKKICFDNCLLTVNPKLAKEWNWDKNKLTPMNVSACSGRKVWWICEKGHEWEAKISSRKFGRRCPYCSNQKVNINNCLKTVKPDLIKEWNWDKNRLNPIDVVAFSNKKVWWICEKGHEWEAPVSRRSLSNRGCPYCSGKLVCFDNCLENKNPILAREWSKKNKKLPSQVTANSNKKFWWVCEKGHEWEATVNSRNCLRSGCPYCSIGPVSNASQKWLDLLQVENREVEIYLYNGKKIIVDGYDPISKTIYEYDGCFWHGCERCFPTGINPKSKTSFSTLLKTTERRRKIIIKSGFNLIYIWGCDFKTAGENI